MLGQDCASEEATLLTVETVAATYDTKQGIVVERLRSAILDEELQPGQRLRLRDLAELLETSTMPIREALQVLAAEGLVQLHPYRGAQVTPLSTEELEELYMARLGLEGLAARLGAVNMRPGELEHLRQLLPVLEQTASAGDLARFLLLDIEFHETQFRASRRPRLVARIDQLRRSCNRYVKRARIAILDEEGTRRLHRALVDACAAGDGALAEQIMRSDIDAAVSSIRPHTLRGDGHTWSGETQGAGLYAGHRADNIPPRGRIRAD